MEAVVQQLRETFPLLAHISVRDAGTQHCDNLPPYLGMIWSVLARPPLHPICFVFPRRGEIARLAAVTHCLNRLSQLHKDAVAKTSLSQFKAGERVLVHPSREVFIYRGPHPDISDRFCLGELDRNTSITLSLPLSSLRRLEPTTRKRPKGDIGKARQLLHSPKAALDLLLGTDTYGNLSAVLNQVLLLDSKSGFAEFAAGLHFQPAAPFPGLPSAAHMVPFGTLEQAAPHKPVELHKWDAASAAGEPLLAVTSSGEILSAYCRDAAPRTKLVLVNGLARLRDLQVYDDLAGAQNLVLFADQDEVEMIQSLGGSGCRFWYLQESELLANANGTSPGRLLGSIARWTRNRDQLVIDSEHCEDPKVDGIHTQLDLLRPHLMNAEEGPVDRIVSWAWQSFSRLRSRLGPPSPDELHHSHMELEVFRRDIKNYSAWMKPEVSVALTALAAALAAAHDASQPVGAAKGAALKGVVSEALRTKQKIALLSKNEKQVAEIRKWAYARAFPANLGIYSPRTLPDEEPFDRLICVSWLGGETMKQLAGRLAAPRITVVGYPCERRWLQQSRNRLISHTSIGGLSALEKAAFVNHGGGRLTWPAAPSVPVPTAPVAATSEVWDFEQRLRSARVGLAARPTEALETIPAWYVRFTGEHYAFLTENHRLPVATELLSGKSRPNQKLPERALGDIKSGDFVVFPDSGDRQLVHMLADKLLGKQALDLRRRAHNWQTTLLASGLTPEAFHLTAKALDMHRHPNTIRHWFEDGSRIGPRLKDDLVLIGLATGDRKFEALIDDTWTAIETLRGAHLSAGMRLREILLQRLPSVMGRIEENGTEVDLGELGSAWIVQVDSIANTHEPRGRGETNRLLKEHAALPASLFI